MTGEELSLKLGIDGSGFSQGVRGIKGQISEFAETSGKAFTHGASAAKGFKAAMHEISNEAPLLGSALKLALSPVGGMVIIATQLFGYFKGKIEETNKELDRLSELAAKSIGNMPDALNKAREKVAEVMREQQKWWGSVIDAQDEATKGLKEHLDGMDAQAKVNDKLLAQEKEKSLYAVKAKEAAGLLTPYEAAVQTQKIEQNYATGNYNQQLAGEKNRQAYLTQQAGGFETKRAEAEERVDQLELKQKQQAAHAETYNLPGALADYKSGLAEKEKNRAARQEELDASDSQLELLKKIGGPNLSLQTSPSAQTLKTQIADAETRAKKAQEAYNSAADGVKSFTNAIKETEDAIYKRGNEEKTTADELARARGEYEKYEAARKTAQEGADKAGTTVVVLTKQGAPFVPPAEPKKGMFNPTVEQLAGTPNPNQREARRAMQIPGEATQARLRGDYAGADKLESEYNDLMFGKETDMFGETTGRGPIEGPPGTNAMEEWNRKHGIAYHSKYDEKTKLGGLHRTGGLQGLLNGQRKDYLEELYKLLSGMSVNGGDSGKGGNRLRIQPSLDK